MKPEKKHYKGKRAAQAQSLPFRKENYIIFLIGLVFIILGFYALAQPPWDSFSSLTLAPILLVVGYCVIVPVAILYQRKIKSDKKEDDTASPSVESE